MSTGPAGASPTVTRVVGALGPLDEGARDRVHRAAALAGGAAGPEQGLRQIHSCGSGLLFGTEAVAQRADPSGSGYAWTMAGAPGHLYSPGSTRQHSWEEAARIGDAAGVVIGEETATVHGSVSGAQPLYVHLTADAVFFATELGWLVETAAAPLAPDWDAWAQILGMGAPLAGRTTFAGMHRLGPMQHVTLNSTLNSTLNGTASSTHSSTDRPALQQAHWPWMDVEPDPDLPPESLTDQVLAALRDQVSGHLFRHDEPHPVDSMLSGGRDSRILTALARQLARRPGQVTAWTTSSDTGTSLEELVAARVANTLNVDQRIIGARHDRFAQDFDDYARAVDYQASYHVWLMPVAQRLAQTRGTILDGLGGGVFLGGGFPDPQPAPSRRDALRDARFSRMTRYLEEARWVLADGLTERFTERARADFEPQAEPFLDHPNGATLSAYLARTLPGISMAPARVLAGSRPTSMPMVSDQMVSVALRAAHAAKRDGAWYPDLMRRADARLEGAATAADLTGPRQHIRRGASLRAARFYRELILTGPTAELVSEGLRRDDDAGWARRLSKTKQQHLIRGLGMLSLWLQRYGDAADGPGGGPGLTETDLGGLQHG